MFQVDTALCVWHHDGSRQARHTLEFCARPDGVCSFFWPDAALDFTEMPLQLQRTNACKNHLCVTRHLHVTSRGACGVLILIGCTPLPPYLSSPFSVQLLSFQSYLHAPMTNWAAHGGEVHPAMPGCTVSAHALPPPPLVRKHACTDMHVHVEQTRPLKTRALPIHHTSRSFWIMCVCSNASLHEWHFAHGEIYVCM